MITSRSQRVWYILAATFSIACAVALALMAFKDSVVFFFSPSELIEKSPPSGQLIRVGGLVKIGSILKNKDTLVFTVTDSDMDIKVEYRGIVPDLFREGQGVVAEGYYVNNMFNAKSILAKHDENYMPPQVAKSLEEKGWYKPS